MLNKKIPINTDHSKTNRIVEGTFIKGDITSETDFRLDGVLEGNFTSAGKIVIGPTGKVVGDITCKNADIEGKFEGKIEIEDLLMLKASADVSGEVVTGKLSVEPGAAFGATCAMKNTVKQISKVNGQQAG